MVPPVFDPSTCRFGIYPTLPGKPWLSHGSNNSEVGYLESVLNCKFNQNCYDVHAPPGPWYFGTSTITAVENAQRWAKIYVDPSFVVDGVVGPQTWGLIDDAATWP